MHSRYKSVNRSKKHSPKKKWWLLVSVLVLAVGTIATLELTNTIHWFRNEVPAAKVIKKAGKPITTPVNNTSAQSSAVAKTINTNSNRVIGGGIDTNGSTTTTTPASQWVTSTSGDITVKQPAANATLTSGSVLSGSANVSTVNFRLIDSSVGVISEGTLNVVNGNFSGKLVFTPHSSTGRLDVFSTNSQGVELNEVQITVDF